MSTDGLISRIVQYEYVIILCMLNIDVNTRVSIIEIC